MRCKLSAADRTILRNLNAAGGEITENAYHWVRDSAEFKARIESLSERGLISIVEPDNAAPSVFQLTPKGIDRLLPVGGRDYEW